jgi:hypothetical protein
MKLIFISQLYNMGCWDIFCFICGNPCHSINYTNEDLLNIKLDYSTNKIDIIDELQKLSKNVKWMNNCTMLLEDNTVIHGVKEVKYNVGFMKKNIHYEHIYISYQKNINNFNGFFIHTDCWNFIKNTYNINLKFSNLPPYKLTYEKIFNINYGDIEKYWSQFFDFPQIVLDNKSYLCSSPFKNDKNISQIKKNINKLKLKNDPNRKGPSVSATFFKENDIKLGNNKKFWIIKSNKWKQINEQVIKIKIKITNEQVIQRKIIEKIPYCGYYNTKPIFIKSYNKKEVELITITSYKLNL